MMQKSIHHAVARIKIIEDRLIGRDRINRMIESHTPEDAFRVLQDGGYGAAATVDMPRDFEQMIAAEFAGLKALMDEISPDSELTDVLLMRYDYKNAKALLKMRMSSVDDDAAIADSGRIPARELREMVFSQDTFGLPAHLAQAIEKAEMQIAIDPVPYKIDNIIDKAYIDWAVTSAKRKKSKFLTELFIEWIDMNNVLSLLRVRQMDADINHLQDALLDDGLLPLEMVLDAYALSDELVGMHFRDTPYGFHLENEIEKAIRQKRAWQFEHYIENLFIACAKKQKKKIFGMDPIISYIVAKENEATAVRMVMTGKLNDIDIDQIRGRLRDLYA